MNKVLVPLIFTLMVAIQTQNKISHFQVLTLPLGNTENASHFLHESNCQCCQFNSLWTFKAMVCRHHVSDWSNLNLTFAGLSCG